MKTKNKSESEGTMNRKVTSLRNTNNYDGVATCCGCKKRAIWDPSGRRRAGRPKHTGMKEITQVMISKALQEGHALAEI